MTVRCLQPRRPLARNRRRRPLVHLWDVESGKLVHEFEQNGGGVFTLEFSPDGKTLAISGFDPVASLWDVATGTQIGPKLTAGNRTTMIDLSPDGRLMLDVSQRPGSCVGRRPRVLEASGPARWRTAR